MLCWSTYELSQSPEVLELVGEGVVSQAVSQIGDKYPHYHHSYMQIALSGLVDHFCTLHVTLLGRMSGLMAWEGVNGGRDDSFAGSEKDVRCMGQACVICLLARCRSTQLGSYVVFPALAQVRAEAEPVWAPVAKGQAPGRREVDAMNYTLSVLKEALRKYR